MSENYGVSERQPFVDEHRRITRPWLGVLQRALRKSQAQGSPDSGGSEAAALLAVFAQTSRPRQRAASLTGTHAERGGYAAAAYPGTFYYETDRHYTYLSIAGAWTYAAGAMVGLLAARPADLGAADNGALFNSTDALDYRWDGAAWNTLDTVRGGAALATVGAIPKVSAAGTLSESAVKDDGTNVIVTGRKLGIGATPKAPLDVLGALRAISTAAAAPATGKGVEVRYSSGVDKGEILSYDRDAAAYKDLGIDGNTLLFRNAGTEIARIDAAGLDVTGAGAVYKIGGVSGVTGGLSLALTTQVVNYKDHASVNQTVTVVTNVTLTANAFTGGIRTT